MAYICRECPRNCGAERRAEDGDGVCRCGTHARVARAAVHRGEEPCISGTHGSGTVFFSGCNLGCLFCQNAALSQENFGRSIADERLLAIFGELRALGVHNINLVTPSHYSSLLARLLPPDFGIPFVWNSGGYDAVSSLRALAGKVQIYMPDCKYMDASAAARYSRAPDYPEAARAAITEMVRQTGPYRLDADGILQSGVLIRHLVLPDNLENTYAVLDWVSSAFPKGTVLFSLMAQYTPLGDLSRCPELARPLTRQEYDRVLDYLYLSDIADGYVQELDASGTEAIPAFDLTGV